MTETVIHINVTTLAALTADERLISANRRALHRSIDAIYMSAPLNSRQTAELDLLETQERNVSAQRHRLHAQIDALRAEMGLPRWREGRFGTAAA